LSLVTLSLLPVLGSTEANADLFTAGLYAGVVYAIVLCLAVHLLCPSDTSVLSMSKVPNGVPNARGYEKYKYMWVGKICNI